MTHDFGIKILIIPLSVQNSSIDCFCRKHFDTEVITNTTFLFQLCTIDQNKYFIKRPCDNKIHL